MRGQGPVSVLSSFSFHLWLLSTVTKIIQSAKFHMPSSAARFVCALLPTLCNQLNVTTVRVHSGTCAPAVIAVGRQKCLDPFDVPCCFLTLAPCVALAIFVMFASSELDWVCGSGFNAISEDDHPHNKKSKAANCS